MITVAGKTKMKHSRDENIKAGCYSKEKRDKNSRNSLKEIKHAYKDRVTGCDQNMISSCKEEQKSDKWDTNGGNTIKTS